MGQAPRTYLRKDQFARTDNDLISLFFVFFNLNARLFRLMNMQLEPIVPPLLDFHIQSVPRLIDKVMPILDKQPNFVIRAPRVFARKIQMHHDRL
jgi:hypothetical protein